MPGAEQLRLLVVAKRRIVRSVHWTAYTGSLRGQPALQFVGGTLCLTLLFVLLAVAGLQVHRHSLGESF